MSIVTVKRTERGWCGHCILGDRCQFRRNTLLDAGGTRVVVSTVGALRHRDKPGYDTVGCDRHFETMAFMAVWRAPYWDTDLQRQVAFTSPWQIKEISRDSDQIANDMHEAVVEELSQKLAAGQALEVES